MKEIFQTGVNRFTDEAGPVAEVCLTFVEVEYAIADAPTSERPDKWRLVKMPRLETVRFAVRRESYAALLRSLCELGEEMGWVEQTGEVKS
jgi:hypothetical protein